MDRSLFILDNQEHNMMSTIPFGQPIQAHDDVHLASVLIHIDFMEHIRDTNEEISIDAEYISDDEGEEDDMMGDHYLLLAHGCKVQTVDALMEITNHNVRVAINFWETNRQAIQNIMVALNVSEQSAVRTLYFCGDERRAIELNRI